MTLNPDIVVDDGMAVADVKYKLAGNEWRRSDLYQVVTFATGYGTPFAAIVDFKTRDTPPLPSVPVGDVSLVELSWPADPSVTAEDAASRLVTAFSTWLTNCGVKSSAGRTEHVS